jgi:Putative Ig domain/Neocarzinostatin family
VRNRGKLWPRPFAKGAFTSIAVAVAVVGGAAVSIDAGASTAGNGSAAEKRASASTCPALPSGPWSGSTVENNEATSGAWAATFRFSRVTGSTWRVTGTMNLVGQYVGITSAVVIGTVHCTTVNIGSGGYTFLGTLTPDGKSASGTWSAPANDGNWSGAFSPPPAIAVTRSTDLVDAQVVNVHGTNFAPSAQMAVYQCPASARLSSDCDIQRPPTSVTTSASGGFAIVLPVYQTLLTSNGVVNCVKTPCVLRAEYSLGSQLATASISFAKQNIGCTSQQSCRASLTTSASTTAPGQTVTVVGRPTDPTGTVLLDLFTGVLACPHLPATLTPIADLIDTGFAPATRLTVTETLHLTTANSAQQVCFNSSVPFRSQSSPKAARAGTALLLDCTADGNRAPCVQSRAQTGTDMVLTFVVPGGDPRFSIVSPKGQRMWLSKYGTARVGKHYAAQLQSSGGKAPISWKVASGRLPAGCTLNAKTGAITGTPTKKGRYTPLVQATDSEPRPQNASMVVPITVT